MTTPPDDEPVPKLPRGRGLTLSRPQIVRILGMLAILIVLLVMQKPCADNVSKFVTGYGAGQGSGSARGSGAGSGSDLDMYERLRPGMTEAETREAIERAKQRAAGSASAGSGDLSHESMR